MDMTYVMLHVHLALPECRLFLFIFSAASLILMIP